MIDQALFHPWTAATIIGFSIVHHLNLREAVMQAVDLQVLPSYLCPTLPSSNTTQAVKMLNHKAVKSLFRVLPESNMS